MKAFHVLLMVAALRFALPSGARAQKLDDMEDVLTAAIGRLHALTNGRSAGLADPRSLLANDVTRSAARKLRATLVRPGEKSDTAGVTYYITGIKAHADTVVFNVEQSFRDGERVWSANSAVWVARKGNEWIVTRVRRRSIT